MMKNDGGLAAKVLALAAAAVLPVPAAVKIEKVPYGGWPNCYKVSNGEVELIVTTDIGPRIMRYGFVGGQNLFKEFKDQLGKSGEKEWQLRGGHRIWVAPEMVPESYAPDNIPVQAVVKGDVITLTEPLESGTGFQKEMVIQMAPAGSAVTVTHRIRNHNNTAKRFGVWAMSMMAQGGTAITGFPPRGTHDEYLQPTNPLTMWAYTDFSDPRWKFTTKYVALHQDPKNAASQKTGLYNKETWVSYLLGSDLFVKRTAATEPPAAYPDFGCSFEMYTSDEFIEIETLGPVHPVVPHQQIEHVEHWTLHKDVHIPALTDAEIDRVVLPLVKTGK
jgi:hypothetical protein